VAPHSSDPDCDEPGDRLARALCERALPLSRASIRIKQSSFSSLFLVLSCPRGNADCRLSFGFIGIALHLQGTDVTTAETLKQQGFDARVSSLVGMFGGGSYFAENSSKSNQVRKIFLRCNGHKCMTKHNAGYQDKLRTNIGENDVRLLSLVVYPRPGSGAGAVR
jgi:hypothetical protein